MKTLKISRPWPPDATDRVHELMAQLAQKELECQRLREAAYPRLIRDDFERRMKARGHGSVAMSRLSGGEYMSPAVDREWEAEKRKYRCAIPPNQDRGLTK